MRYENPYDSGWRMYLLAGAMIAGAVLIIYALKIGPKLEVCRVYYPEIGQWSCLMSDYGLPPQTRK